MVVHSSLNRLGTRIDQLSTGGGAFSTAPCVERANAFLKCRGRLSHKGFTAEKGAPMSVTKRTRYEVLKRDNHTCRYCGGIAPDVSLTVDHVTPVALGGADDPSNLVAACKDCNAGKTSTSPDASLVADVKQIDIQWAGAIGRVAKARARQRKKRTDYLAAFLAEWEKWEYGWYEKLYPLPTNYESSIARFYDLGVPIEEVTHCVRVACGNSKISPDDTYRYFAGCVWRVVTEMQDAAKALLTAEAADGDA